MHRIRVPFRKRLSAGYIDRAETMAARERGSRSLFFRVSPSRGWVPPPPLQGASARVRSSAQLIRPNSEVRPVPAIRSPLHPDALESLIARRSIRLDNARRTVFASYRYGFRTWLMLPNWTIGASWSDAPVARDHWRGDVVSDLIMTYEARWLTGEKIVHVRSVMICNR